MPAAYFRIEAKAIGRSGSRSASGHATYQSGSRGAVGAAVYRAGERLTDRAAGRDFDFTNKGGIEDAYILTPEDAPEWAHDRQELWNQADAAETRSNGRVATELQLGLPKELTFDQRRELVNDFIQPIVDKYHVAADVALHQGNRPELTKRPPDTHKEI